MYITSLLQHEILYTKSSQNPILGEDVPLVSEDVEEARDLEPVGLAGGNWITILFIEDIGLCGVGDAGLDEILGNLAEVGRDVGLEVGLEFGLEESPGKATEVAFGEKAPTVGEDTLVGVPG